MAAVEAEARKDPALRRLLGAAQLWMTMLWLIGFLAIAGGLLAAVGGAMSLEDGSGGWGILAGLLAMTGGVLLVALGHLLEVGALAFCRLVLREGSR